MSPRFKMCLAWLAALSYDINIRAAFYTMLWALSLIFTIGYFCNELPLWMPLLTLASTTLHINFNRVVNWYLIGQFTSKLQICDAYSDGDINILIKDKRLDELLSCGYDAFVGVGGSYYRSSSSKILVRELDINKTRQVYEELLFQSTLAEEDAAFNEVCKLATEAYRLELKEFDEKLKGLLNANHNEPKRSLLG